MQKTLEKFATLNLGHPSVIPANHWADTMNMVQASDGLWENRKGVKTFSSSVGSSKKVHSVHFWKPGTMYTPAYLTGGSSATSVVATWVAVTDGSFRMSLDGVSNIDFTGIDFSSGVTTMADVASKIQTKIRSVTGSTETVVWSSDHFVISSVDVTSASAISVTSSAGVGTDISGAGGTAFMDAETGRGTVTDKAAQTSTLRHFTVGSGTALYSYTEGSNYNDGTFTSRQTGFTDAQPFEFSQYKDYLLATNGVQAMYSTLNNTKWTVRNGANTRVAKYVHFANDVGYCASVPGARSVMYYGSAVPANPWEFANSVDIESDNGQILTGLTNLGPIILGGKNKSIYSVDIATPAREQLDYGAGIVSHRSIVKAENSVYIGSNEGIFTVAQRQGVTSSLAATPLSDPITPLWKILTNKGAIAGVYFPSTRSIYWAVQTDTAKYVLVYNIQHRSWSYLVGVNASDWSLYEDSSGVEHLIYGDSTTDKIRELEYDERSDDDTPINSALLTGSLNFGTESQKTINFLEIAGYGSSLMELDYELFFDEEEVASVSGTIDSTNFATVTTSGSGSLASGSLASESLSGYIESSTDLEVKFWIKRVPLEKTFRTLRIKLTNAQAGVRWRFKSFNFDMEGEPEDVTPDYIFA